MSVAAARAGTALLLALAAGSVDAISFVVLHETFTANMTGNSTELGIAAGRANPQALIPLAAAVGTFVGAIVLGTVLIELLTRRGMRATAAPAFLVEAALLAVFMAYGSNVLRHNSAPDHAIGGFYVLLTVAIVAMGVQAATLTKALGATVRTTYVSGLLTTFAQEVVNLAAGGDAERPSYLRDELGLGDRRASLRRLMFHLAVFLCFVAGSVWGAWGEGRWTTWALALPVGLLLAAAAVDLAQPVHEA